MTSARAQDLPGLSRGIARVLREGGEAAALEYAGRWHSWAALCAMADQLSQIIDTQCPGEIRIGLVARNKPVVLAAMLGLIARGITVVMIHGGQRPERLAKEIAELNLAAIAAEVGFWQDSVRAAALQAGTLQIALPDALDGSIEAITHGGKRDPVAANPAVALELLSSGTTGPPKRIPILWRTLEMALGTAHGTALSGGGKLALSGKDLPPAISGLSLGNIGGVYMMLPSVLIGQRIVMLDKFSVDPWVRAVRVFRPAILSVQPAGLRMILDAGVPQEALSSLKTIVSGASKLDPDLQDEFERCYGVRVFGAYGATETCGSIIVWTDELYDRYRHEKRASVGRPVPGVEVRIVDPATGKEAQIGKTGLLHARVDRVGPDWIETTDLAHVDEDGFVYIDGRADNAIDRGGYSVPPDYVADALRRHPAVRDASVVGLPDARLGQVPVAAVELVNGAPSPTEDELIAFAGEHLLSYQVPARIIRVDELPRNASLKVMVPQVLELFDST
ncbi:MAG: fatty acid--CoA ligase family protein [Sphingomonadaceae bacterium]|nr:fatty acid--CoA ligase family protein [Sphingomonadaceae bacterium]